MDTITDSTLELTQYLPSTSTIFTAYASTSATVTLLKQAYYQFIPTSIHDRLTSFLHRLFRRHSTSIFTLLVEEYEGVKRNPLFEAFEAYLCHKVLTTSASCLKATTDSIASSADGVPLSLSLARDEEFKEVFNGAEIFWDFSCVDPPKGRRPKQSY